MRMISAGICLVCVFAGCGVPTAADRWTVMTWNVQNLFDGEDDGTEYPEFDPGGGQWSRDLYLRRLELCSEVIRSCGAPDLVVMQEIEKKDVLDDLADGALRQHGYRWRLAVPGSGGIRCGILSRYPIGDVLISECGTFGDRPLRPLLMFTVHTAGGPVRVAAVHWKSPRDGREVTEPARIAEATETLRSVAALLETDPETQIILIGDFNTPGDKTVLPAAMLPWEGENGYLSHDGTLFVTGYPEGAGVRDGVIVFHDPEPEGGAGGTYWYRDAWDRPDHVLLTPGVIFPPGLVFSECLIGAEEVMCDSNGRPIPWRTDLEDGYSDHLPIVVVFDVLP